MAIILLLLTLSGVILQCMANSQIQKLRAERKVIEEKINTAKSSRRQAPDDAVKAEFTAEIEKLRSEKKRIGEALRDERSKLSVAK